MTDTSDQRLAPIALRVATAVHLTDLSRSRIYEHPNGRYRDRESDLTSKVIRLKTGQF